MAAKRTSAAKKSPAKKAAKPAAKKLAVPKTSAPKGKVKKAAVAKKPASKKAASAKKATSKTPSKKASKPAVKKATKPVAKKAAKSAVKKAAKPVAKKSPPKKSSVKKAVKPASKKATPAPKPATKKAAAKKAAPAKKVSAKKAAAPAKEAPAPAAKPKAKGKKSKALATPAAAPSGPRRGTGRRQADQEEGITLERKTGVVKMTPFLKRQRQRLIDLRDAYLNTIEGVSNEAIRNASENGSSSAFGMHQADAGSDAYDRDFALSLLGKEQDALYEINEAIDRIEGGTYGICEMSGEKIPEVRLEALPFTRFTVQCQEKIERQNMGGRWNQPVRSLFGLDDAGETSADSDDDSDSLDSSK